MKNASATEENRDAYIWILGIVGVDQIQTAFELNE